MNRNILSTEAELEAESAQKSPVANNESLASRSETTAPTVDSIIEQVRRDASRDAVKYLLRSDVGHDGE